MILGTKILWFALPITLIFSPIMQAKDCTMRIKPGTEKVTWTGYKFTEKAPVQGTFDAVTMKQNDVAKNEKELFESIEFKIEAASISTGMPQRDKKLALFVFGALKDPGVISGKVTKFDSMGASAVLTMNGVTKELVFKHKEEEKKHVFSSEFDFVDFAMEDAFKRLSDACKDLHIGKDNLSKTWSTVGLEVVAEVEKTCK